MVPFKSFTQRQREKEGERERERERYIPLLLLIWAALFLKSVWATHQSGEKGFSFIYYDSITAWKPLPGIRCHADQSKPTTAPSSIQSPPTLPPGVHPTRLCG
jgi:hypothetical protein